MFFFPLADFVLTLKIKRVILCPRHADPQEMGKQPRVSLIFDTRGLE